jgi:hypothetical protein
VWKITGTKISPNGNGARFFANNRDALIDRSPPFGD